MSAPCVELLAKLIGFRTQNPGGDELALCTFLADELAKRGADAVDVAEVARERDGVITTGAYVFARWGTPHTIINVHVDTVPANTGWTTDPWTAQVTSGRVVGLGSADTKGAIAAALTAVDRIGTPANVGMLFSGDEERGSTVMRAFLASDHAASISRALVCEPTARCAGVRHRGVMGYRAQVEGRGGHSSNADRMPKPIVDMAHLGVALDELGKTYLDVGPNDMKGLCMNVAGLEGGVAFNVVPDGASLTWSVRPPPGFDETAFANAIDEAAANAGKDIHTEQIVHHPPFAMLDESWAQELLQGRVKGFVGLQFWTEAALLAGAGIDAVVVGPGDIAQAHAADEFVSIDDLEWATDMFAHVLETCRGTK